MKLRITVEKKTYEVEVEVLDEGPGGPLYGSTSVHSSTIPAPVASRPATAPATDSPQQAAETTPSGRGGEHVVKAPLVGTITQLKVAPGDSVSVNQVLLVMEAMKMETNIASPVAGKVKVIRVSVGDAVKSGQVLIELE